MVSGQSPQQKVDTTMASEESELVRALKQMIELRSSSNTSNKQSTTQPEVTLFGHKISQAQAQHVDQSTVAPSSKASSLAAESIEKLLAGRANENLKQLYKQHLRKRVRPANADASEANSASGTAEILTLPLLKTLDKRQDEHPLDVKRRKIEGNSSEKSRPSGQLTLFYKGTVYVYEDVPLDKAKAMMVVAGSASSRSAHYLQKTTVETAPSAGNSYAAVLDLPQARKASLHRFLERRKAREEKACPWREPNTEG